MGDEPEPPILVEVESGGRKLAVQSWGDPGGHVVFLLHGMPGSRLGPRPRGIVLERMGIRLISYDRPGYGHSGRQPHRTVAHAAADVERIADLLDVKQFAVVGRSGGGPHALACAARISPERVQRVALLVSVAPPNAAGLVWDEGMASLNTGDFADADRTLRDASAERRAQSAVLAARVAEMQQDPESLIRLLQPELSDSDLRFINDQATRQLLTAAYAEAVRDGAGGWIDDSMALRTPWGFDFEDVQCPVLLWHGHDDRFSPVSHTLWLADRLRATRADERDRREIHVQIDHGAAHFAAFEVFTEVLRWLVDPHPAPAPSLARTAVGRVPGGSGSRSAAPLRSGARSQSTVRVGR